MQYLCSITILLGICISSCNNYEPALSSSDYKHYIDSFNEKDDELYKFGEFTNEESWGFLKDNIPLFDCPDKEMEETYYFRWWTYRKHIRNTPEGYIITEFLPDVPWAGPYNAISCPGAHHFNEGRWLRDSHYLRDYANFWLNGSGQKAIRVYTFWIADALLNFSMIHPSDSLLKEHAPRLEKNFSAWETENKDSTGLFWQFDGRDGMEESISGSYANPYGAGYRATINSYMYGEAKALFEINSFLGSKEKSLYYKNKSEEIHNNINNRLWDAAANFFKVIPKGKGQFSDVRELHGYTPWYFNIPDNEKGVAWSYLMNPEHFYADYGPTTAEQCHPLFGIAYTGHECQWNGPSWPFATSITLTALANFLNNYQEQNYISADDYFQLLKIYAKSHRIVLEGEQSQPWIDENLNPYTGDWISRTRLKTWKNGTWDIEKGGVERGKDYNHSTFNDLIISGLVGLRPSLNNILTVNPLVPKDKWNYFCLENVPYKGYLITILFDKTGKQYNRGRGFFIYIDGKCVHKSINYGKYTILL